MNEVKVKIGIIGGSGLYKMEVFKDVEEIKLDIFFGFFFDVFIVGILEGI